MDECMPEFLIEAAEALSALDSDLAKLEETPSDTAAIGSIFRTLHSIKGTSGFLGLTRLGQVCHAGEGVLAQLRDGALRPSLQVIAALFRCVGAIKGILDTIATLGNEGTASIDELIAELSALHVKNAPSAAYEAGGDSVALQALFDATPAGVQVHRMATADCAPPRMMRGVSERTVGNDPTAEVAFFNPTIRVGVGLLEELTATVSELALTSSRLLRLLRGENGGSLEGPLRQLALITSDLQEIVMKTRLQPIGAAWSVLPRVVHDLAQKLGKKIELFMDGADTELDRQVVELIKDPLIHMVRNAADHGLEEPGARAASGKSKTGRIRLHAFHDVGRVVIQVVDDGRGLNAGKIRRKASERGLATKVEINAMTDQEVFRFILRPGFTTASAITGVSGRGIGMDVVRANIERIGGTIDIESKAGQGASFTIRIPLKLEIAPPSIQGRGFESLHVLQ